MIYIDLLNLKQQIINRIKYIYKNYIIFRDTKEEIKDFIFVGLKKDKYAYIDLKIKEYLRLSNVIEIEEKIKNLKNLGFNKFNLFLIYFTLFENNISSNKVKTEYVYYSEDNKIVLLFDITNQKIYFNINDSDFYFINSRENKKTRNFIIETILKGNYFIFSLKKQEINLIILKKNNEKRFFNAKNYQEYNIDKNNKLLNNFYSSLTHIKRNYYTYHNGLKNFLAKINKKTFEILEQKEIDSNKIIFCEFFINNKKEKGFLEKKNNIFYYEDFKKEIELNKEIGLISKGYNLFYDYCYFTIYSDIDLSSYITNMNREEGIFAKITIDEAEYILINYKYRIYLIRYNDNLFGLGISEKQFKKNIKNKYDELLFRHNNNIMFTNL